MGWDNIFHCEWNPFGQKVLKHHFPNSISYNDITKTDFTVHEGRIDILTGGFPCQPYSTAGLQKGKADERHLFPEMLRAIKEIKPRWIIGENVRGLVSWGGDWYSKRCALIWKGKAMKCNRFLFQLQVSTHRTEEIGFGLLLTPTTREEVQDLEKFQQRMEKYPNGTKIPNLATQVHSLLPTPTTRSDGGRATTMENGVMKNKSHTTGTTYGITLGQLAKAQMLPTPSAYDWNTSRKEETFIKAQARHKAKGVNLQNPLKQMATMGMLPTPSANEDSYRLQGNTQASKCLEAMARKGELENGKRSPLSPRFVLEMMGFPIDWTLLPFLSGEKNQLKQLETL
jgi:site-specific DNA-cytosine methylase